MKLRVLRDGPCTGAVNMKTDARLLDEHAPGDDPVLRLYSWKPWAVSYGYHQHEEDFRSDVIAERGWGLVRRPTGGRAILHAQELTYAVIGTSPSELFGSDLHATYSIINQALLKCLRGLGLDPDLSQGETLAEARGAVCFQSAGKHEVTVGGRKIIGSAQRRKGEVFLQHGSILLGPAHVDLVDCLPEGEATEQRRAMVLEATTDLERLTGEAYDESSLDALGDRLATCFAETMSLEIEPITV